MMAHDNTACRALQMLLRRAEVTPQLGLPQATVDVLEMTCIKASSLDCACKRPSVQVSVVVCIVKSASCRETCPAFLVGAHLLLHFERSSGLDAGPVTRCDMNWQHRLTTWRCAQVAANRQGRCSQLLSSCGTPCHQTVSQWAAAAAAARRAAGAARRLLLVSAPG